MSNHQLAKLLTDKLPFGQPELLLFNPYRDRCDEDEVCNGPEAKLARLAAHLDCNPDFIFCGEAPSHRGCRYSGIAFTSEYLLQQGKVPRIPAFTHRLTRYKNGPYKERSATIVWNALHHSRIADRTILWNALPIHPYKPRNVHSNRTPSPEEIKKFGKPALEVLVKAFPSAKLIAVGKKAEWLLERMGIEPEGTVSHPASRGHGPNAFAQKLGLIVHGKRTLATP